MFGILFLTSRIGVDILTSVVLKTTSVDPYVTVSISGQSIVSEVSQPFSTVIVRLYLLIISFTK